MNRVIIDGSSIQSREELHRLLAQALHFPEWYGGNLDALFDCLTDLQEETELVLCQRELLKNVLGPYETAFERVLTRAGEENPRIRLLMADQDPAVEKCINRDC